MNIHMEASVVMERILIFKHEVNNCNRIKIAAFKLHAVNIAVVVKKNWDELIANVKC